ncbi:hypothetical protein GCM10008985_22280 [Halococcus dombrowskii]|uniref:Transposase n=1 Tax=Halococcus dombrowskii TaxID=179637 RepID=A0AAV3SGM2_HALDO
MFGFAAGESRTLAAFHRAYNATADKTLSPGERPHDSTEFKTGSWLEGRLLLLDLAHFKFRRFALIDENGGYFVSRLKRDTKH